MNNIDTSTPHMAPPTAIELAYQRPNQRQPRRIADKGGAAIVQMPLAGGAVATVDADSFDHYAAPGRSTQWCLMGDGKGNAYVGVWLPSAKTTVMVARLLLDAPRGKVIRFHDRNPLNLQRSNLYLDAGFAKQREKDVAQSAELDEQEGFIF